MRIFLFPVGQSLLPSAAAETVVQPNAPTISIDRLEGRYLLADMKDAGNGKVSITVYGTETFPAEAIEGLKPGDRIVTGGGEYTVSTVGPFADYEDTIVLNTGAVDELLFEKNGHNEYVQAGTNDEHPQIHLGTVTAELNEYTCFIDRVDPKTGNALDKPVLRSGRDLIDAMNTDEIGFSSMNVYVAFNEFNDPVLIVRIYTPWQ